MQRHRANVEFSQKLEGLCPSSKKVGGASAPAAPPVPGPTVQGHLKNCGGVCSHTPRPIALVKNEVCWGWGVQASLIQTGIKQYTKQLNVLACA